MNLLNGVLYYVVLLGCSFTRERHCVHNYVALGIDMYHNCFKEGRRYNGLKRVVENKKFRINKLG